MSFPHYLFEHPPLPILRQGCLDYWSRKCKPINFAFCLAP